MKIKYTKPTTRVVVVQAEHYLLAGSNEQGISVTMSGYGEADTESDNDGFSQDE